MFYEFLYPLHTEHILFNVFRYITFRTAAATLTALFLSFLLGPPLIRYLGRLRVDQPIRARSAASSISSTLSTSGMPSRSAPRHTITNE